MSGSEATMATLRPADMTNDQLDAAATRLANERTRAGGPRRAVIGRVLDAVLDEMLTRRGNTTTLSR